MKMLKLQYLALAACAGLGAASCRQDMHDQPKHKAFTRSVLFKDQRSARPLVPGTVARGKLNESDHYYRGKVDGKPAETFPAELAAYFGAQAPGGAAEGGWQQALVDRGQDRFAIHCTPCHGLVGDGNSIVVQRGMRRPPSFHIERLQKSPPGYFYDVITNGFGAMFDLADRVKVEDRWAIVAYVRALQLSQNATLADVPPSYVQNGEIVDPNASAAAPAHTAPSHGGAHEAPKPH